METSEPSTSTTSTSTINSDSCGQTADNSSADPNAGQSVDEFLSTGRTGRRNAMPDILEEKASQLTTADLPNELQKLNFNDSTQPNGSSGESSGTASCSSNQNK